MCFDETESFFSQIKLDLNMISLNLNMLSLMILIFDCVEYVHSLEANWRPGKEKFLLSGNNEREK